MTVSLSHNADIDIAEKPITEYRFFKELISKPFVEAVYIFGSRSRGEHRDNSDYDLGVVCYGATDSEWDSIKQMVKGNQELLVKIDVARLDKKSEQPFLSHVIRDRKLLYIRTDYVSENNCLHDKLFFIREWDGKMSGWAKDLSNIIKGIEKPDDMLLEKSFISFHYAFDSAWNLYRKCLSLHGMHTNTPLSTFRESCVEGWIENRSLWEQMVEDYHETRNEQALDARRRAYKRFPAYIEAFHGASQAIRLLIRPYDKL